MMSTFPRSPLSFRTVSFPQYGWKTGFKLFTRLLSRCNDVGLLAEEFDPLTGRMLGNFPQAYSQVGLINCALDLSRQKGPDGRARRILSAR